MREIYLVNDSFPPIIDGVANVVVNYADNLRTMGEDVTVITPNHPDANDELFDYPVIRYPSVDLRKQTGYMGGLPFMDRVRQSLEGRKADLIHSHCPITATLVARFLKEQMDAPLVLTYHTKYDIDVANSIKSKLIQESALKAIIENIYACDEVWTVSRGAGENLVANGFEGEYIVMENGVDVPKRRLSREKTMELTSGYDIPLDVPVFLYVGRMMWYKGLKITLDAMQKLKASGRDFRMIFVGKGTDADEIEKYSKECDLSDKCLFIGAVYDREKLCAWYCRADLFIFPSTFDTNGLVVREAAACSVASVLIKDSCASEGVTDKVNGLLIDENAEALAECLKKLMDEPNYYEHMRKLGEKAADDLYFSWEDAVKKASERYEIVIDNYKSGKYQKKRKLLGGILRVDAQIYNYMAELENNIRELESQMREIFGL